MFLKNLQDMIRKQEEISSDAADAINVVQNYLYGKYWEGER